MTAHLTKHCTLVLLLSMALALTGGLMAWGPVLLSPADHAHAGANSVFGIPHTLAALSCVPMCLACVWGLQSVLSAGWPPSLVRPWVGFYVASFLSSGTAGLYHIDADNLGHALSTACAAAAFSMLLLAFLAERLDARFGEARAVAAAAGLAALAGLWWLAGELWGGGGDLRLMLLLQALPALLIPAGALRLPGTHTAGTDWVALLGLYGVARLCDLADTRIFSVTGMLGGHTLMHLVLGAGTAWWVYRVSRAERPAPAALPAAMPSQPSQRPASASTSGW